MHQPFISVIGNVATGKSTISSFLAAALDAHLIRADELYKTNPFFQGKAIVDRARWSLASDLWFLLRRVEMAQQIPGLIHRKIVVQDSGLLMSFAYANSRASQGYMNTQESTLYNEIAIALIKNIPEETLIIYLDLPVNTLRKRIEERQRMFEIKFHSEDYLQHLDQSIKNIIDAQQKRGVKILRYTEDNWCDIVRNRDDQKRLIQDVQTILGEKGVV